MSKLIPVAVAMLVACASPAFASSNFDGTWKGDVKSAQLPKQPNVYLLNARTYTCSTCVPKISIPADGAFHPVVGNPYYDEMSVTVVDANTVRQVSRKGGKTMGESTSVISPDGGTRTVSYTDMTAANGVPVTGQGVDERVAKGPAGAHALSGSWRQTNTAQVSDSGLTYTMQLDGDTMRFSTPTGISYAAKVDGTAAPVTGDPGWTEVSLRRTGPNTLTETDMRDGKPIARIVMTVDATGRTMTVKSNDLLRARTAIYVATKQ